MNTKKLSTAIAATVLVACVPVTTIYAGTALASGQRPDRPAAAARPATTASSSGPNAWASRSSNLPFGGAALSFGGGIVYGAPHPVKTTQSAPNAWASRSSKLPFGGAALYV
ncbi:MAG TPA: hypothetical protein VN786_13135 [Acidimicrobiales bacterium]|nr:hypothetical protein [Acidimicrobiales bacterium]